MFIDFEEENNDREHEPEAMRHMSKKMVWKNLNNRFLMPDPKSRIITRRYLAGIMKEEFYVPDRAQILHFEAVWSQQAD